MDVLIDVAVLLLAVALVALIMAKRGRARQAARTAQLYGHATTFQSTSGKSAALPGRGATFPGPMPDAAPVPGSPEAEGSEAAARMARGLVELLKVKDAGNATHETAAGTHEHPQRRADGT
ncbi:hypothetical protein ART_4082 [Arthrobacter sp. PAMC 25486]|uniref:hypothetical protein n=1 Tax=Arthrobacter sp. PAMC 25486 TaxID=1494608 RepID=UPI000535A1E1|nr:hypothetical protein [Arthrobacter sp. PAMC 25486]AIY03681.1 hypothetical protein ART_4082 [Arthrobacter sp. PAMC 25486]